MGQAIVPYCSVLASWGIARFIKQEQQSILAADDTARARHGLRTAQGQCQPLAEHKNCYTVLYQLHIKHHNFAKTDYRQLQHTQNSSLTRFSCSDSMVTIPAGILLGK